MHALSVFAQLSPRRHPLIALFVAIVGGTLLLAFLSRPRPLPRHIPPRAWKLLETKAAAADCQLKRYPDYGVGRRTKGPVSYPHNPPVVGPSADKPAPDGDLVGRHYPQDRLMRSLVRGRVQFQFAPGTPPERISRLRTIARRNDYHVQLLENRTGMPYRVAAVAWGYSLTCKKDSPQVDSAIDSFRGITRDRAPEWAPGIER